MADFDPAGFDPFDPALADDPYPAYARLRAAHPAYRSPAAGGAWLLSGYAEVVQALRDHAHFSSAPLGSSVGGTRSLIGSDPPDHTVLRRIVQPQFTPSVVARLEPGVRAVARRLVAELVDEASNGPADLVARVAFPLPVTVIADLLGIPPERRDDFKRWSDGMIGGTGGAPSDGGFWSEMIPFFEAEIARRRQEPGDDLISVLVNAAEPLSQRELLMFCTLLLVAGNETTTNLIGSLMLVLLDHPEIVAELMGEPGLVPSAVEECLRFDAPVQALWREVSAPVELGGEKMSPGDRVVVLYGAANRDPARYPQPDRFDIRRDPRDHVGFGAGIHLCLGAPLARLEARVFLEEMLEHLPRLRPGGPVRRVVNPIVRGPSALPVRLA